VTSKFDIRLSGLVTQQAELQQRWNITNHEHEPIPTLKACQPWNK